VLGKRGSNSNIKDLTEGEQAVVGIWRAGRGGLQARSIGGGGKAKLDKD